MPKIPKEKLSPSKESWIRLGKMCYLIRNKSIVTNSTGFDSIFVLQFFNNTNYYKFKSAPLSSIGLFSASLKEVTNIGVNYPFPQREKRRSTQQLESNTVLNSHYVVRGKKETKLSAINWALYRTRTFIVLNFGRNTWLKSIALIALKWIAYILPLQFNKTITKMMLFFLIAYPWR